MPKYKYELSNGKFLTLEGDTQPDDTEVESIAKQNNVQLKSAVPPVNIPVSEPIQQEPLPVQEPVTPETQPEKGWLRKAWDAISTPLTEKPKEVGQGVSDYITEPSLATSPTGQGGIHDYLAGVNARMKGFYGGAAEGVGNVVSDLTSPLNLALTLATAGEYGAGKAGLSQIARLMRIGQKAASIPVAAHGAYETFRPDASLGERGMGLVEMAGGAAPFVHAPSTTPELNAAPENIAPEVLVQQPQLRPSIADRINGALAEPPPVPERVPIQEPNPWLGETINDIGYTETAPIPQEIQFNEAEQKPLNWKTDETRRMRAGEEPTSQVPDVQKLDPRTQALLDKRKAQEEIKATKLTPQELLESDKQGQLQQGYDLFRGLMSVDPPFMTSAAFRQAGKYAGTTEWWKAWAEAAKAFGSKNLADAQESIRLQRPLFKPTVDPATGEVGPSYAEQVGLRRGNLSKYSKRDEAIRGELAEQLPIYGRYVKRSNRAFNAFLNHIADTKLEEMVNTGVKLNEAGKLGGITGNLLSSDVAPNPLTDLTAGKKIADFINTSLHRGKLGIEAGNYNVNLEKNARLLSNTFFSPRNIASQIRMLNPSTYIMAPPQIRRQYLAAMTRQVALWWTMAQLAEWGGAKISKDATSADYGKIRIGNARIDPPGGLQQYLVLGARMGAGGTTSTGTGKFTPFGQGYKPETRATKALQFGIDRLHPTAKIAWDLANATKKAPFHVTDRILQAVLPMYSDDFAKVLKDNPALAPLILGLSGAGMGTQSYERGSYGEPVFIPEKYDLNIGR